MKAIALFFGVFLSLASSAKDFYCFFPGAGGLKSYIEDTVKRQLDEDGVPFVTFVFNSSADVPERAQEVVAQFENLLARHPGSRCHVLGYSMGGVVARYVANHSFFTNEWGEQEAFSKRLLSVASLSSPHYGTPFAEMLSRNYPGIQPSVDNLTEAGMVPYNTPGTSVYSPLVEGIPFYSYATFVLDRGEIVGGMGKIGFQYMTQVLAERGDNTLNDGFVPTASMEFGELLATYRAPHEFMIRQLDGFVDAYDFLKDHWDFLTRRERQRSELRSLSLSSLADWP